MPYYTSIPGISATYIDGSFPTANANTNPRIIVLGTATKGQTYNLFFMNNGPQEIAAEFGADSELYIRAQEAIQQTQGAENIAVMRIGGRQGVFTLEDSLGGKLTLRTELRDNDALKRLKLVLTEETLNGNAYQRILIYDSVKAEYIYDSDGVKALDEALVDIIDGGLEIFTCGDIDTPSTASTPGLATDPNAATATPPYVQTLAVTGDFAAGAGQKTPATLQTVTSVEGDDGTDKTLIEKYAALTQAYQFLDFQQGDILVPSDVYSDSPNVADGDTLTLTGGALPTPAAGGGTADALGYLWQTIYRGKPYTYFTSRSDFYSNANSTTITDIGVQAPILALTFGASGQEVIDLTFDGTAAAVAVSYAAGGAWTIAYNAEVSTADEIRVAFLAEAANQGLIHTCTVSSGAGGDPFTAATTTLPQIALSTTGTMNDAATSGEALVFTLADQVANPSVTFNFDGTATGITVGVVGTAINIAYNAEVSTPAQIKTAYDLVSAATALATLVATGTGGFTAGDGSGGVLSQQVLSYPIADYYVDHNDLTGDVIPSEVNTRFLAGDDTQLREVNFAHQLAVACHKASTTWSTMIGCINVSKPAGFSATPVADWLGDPPTYSYKGTTLVIDGVGNNGVGLLGNKFHAGADNYRTNQIPNGLSEGYAYGGYILTNGYTLPKGNTYGYGVDDGDEALDANLKPMDLGKHILVCAAWPQHNWASPAYIGPLAASLAGKIAVTVENEEPIGVNGGMNSLSMPANVAGPTVNELAKQRYVGLMSDTRNFTAAGQILVSVRTAAHPGSDYARLSTIRSVNRELTGIRSLAWPYIGRAFNSANLQALQTAVDGFLQAERKLGYNQGAVAQLSYTTLDKIAGRLTIKLKMIPPFSIEAIEVETTLAAEEADLV